MERSFIEPLQADIAKFHRLLDGKDVEVKRLYSSKLTIKQIAQKLCVSETVLYEKITTLGLERRKPRFRIKSLDKNKIIELQRLGLSKVAIAEKLRVSVTKLDTFMLENGLREKLSADKFEKFKKTVLLGKELAKQGIKSAPRNKTNKLEPFADEIEELLSEGITKTAIAKRYNVCTGTIYNLIKICNLYAPFIKKLEPKEDIIKKLFVKGFSHEDMAKRLKCSVLTIDKKIKELGLVRQAISPKSPINDKMELLKELYKDGCSNREIAKQLNVHPVWLGKRIKMLNLEKPNKLCERNSVMKGHDEELKQMYQSGMLLKDIGKHFGVKYNTVIYRLNKLGIYQPYRRKGTQTK
ncbi:MAG: hypothetical protein E7013_05640 [Alphaproteobacteria bacterium]|nr:hypothetical protein [Alphaproteobacteria bacterium]